MEKYKIEKDSIQETLVIPLYGRRLCSQQFPGLYQDSTAAMLMEKVDYDFSPLERQANSLMQTFGALEVAMRQNDLAWEVRDYQPLHDPAVRPIHRLLAKLADGPMRLQIVRIDFVEYSHD